MRKQPNKWLFFSALAFQIGVLMYLMLELGNWIEAKISSENKFPTLFCSLRLPLLSARQFFEPIRNALRERAYPFVEEVRMGDNWSSSKKGTIQYSFDIFTHFLVFWKSQLRLYVCVFYWSWSHGKCDANFTPASKISHENCLTSTSFALWVGACLQGFPMYGTLHHLW